MKHFQSILTLFLALRLVVARQCQNITVPVTISSQNGIFDLAAPTSNIEVTNVVLNFGRQGHNYVAEIQRGFANISGTYELAATYCRPDHGHGKTLQVLTHGVGFDRSWWDIPYNNYNYSYVAVAVDEYGYSTLAWDRLGIGMSTIADPISIIQAPLEKAALSALSHMARDGTLPGVSDKPHKVVHVGHSFGSALSYGLTRDEPTISDGLVLTGFSQNFTFMPFFLYGGNWVSVTTVPSLSRYPPGYVAPGDVSAVQNNFFSPGQFDPGLLEFSYTTGQPAGIGELLTIGLEAFGVNPFPGPVLIITGSRDLPFCGGDCLLTGNSLPSIPESSRSNFPNTSDFEVVIVPEAGHGLNLEYSHDYTYQQVQQFFVNHGLTGGWRGRGSGRTMRA